MATVNTLDVLSVACAAYRINGGLLKDATADKNSNALLVKGHFRDSKPLEVTEQDRESAEAVKNYIQQTVMLARLQSMPVNDFTDKISKILDAETTNTVNIGLLTWAPKLYADLQKSSDTKQEVSLIGISSNYIGNVGNKVNINFTTISKRFNTTYNCWRYLGHDGNGNLIGFLNKNEINDGPIKGKIKATEHSKYAGGKVTYLNYVKEVK